MEFRKFSAGTSKYGTDQRPARAQLENVSFCDPKFDEVLARGGADPDKEALVRCLIFLAACHTIVIDARKGAYSASSPDELALVNFAKEYGYKFIERDADDNLIIEVPGGERLSYKLLSVCEFTSTRKRMSCIFRAPDGGIVMMCKGADSVISDLLSDESKASDAYREISLHVDDFACEGLRTLFLAEKRIDEGAYEAWSRKKEEARRALADREAQIAAVDELIEVDLEIVGSTAIEDRL